MNWADLDLSSKTGGMVAGLIGIALGLQKVMTMFKRNRIEDIKADTEHTILDSVHDELKRITDEMQAARKRQNDMNELIHQQAIKLTRMEMLMIRMYGLITNHNIQVPEDMQLHIDDLLNHDRNEHNHSDIDPSRRPDKNRG
jgi:hypothetical protein